MLTITYLSDVDLYMVIPVVRGREDLHYEYMFASEEMTRDFIRAWHRNRIAAIYAYHQTYGVDWTNERIYK